MIAGVDAAARPGDVVHIYDPSGQYFGRGLFNPASEIVVRILTSRDEAVDERFWAERLGAAAALRRKLELSRVTDAYRLVHAEGDGLSGLIAERYADFLVFEIFSLGMHQRIEGIAKALAGVLPPPESLDRPGRSGGRWRVLVRADQRMTKREGFTVAPPPDDQPTSVTIREHGVRYRVDMAAGHKTGFFCDQRDNRLAFAKLSRDADLLDCCCYTGGFGLAAKVLGEAREVTSVDLDEAAIAVAKENANLNQTRINHVHADAFIYLRQMIANGRQFDAMVLDPPKFAVTRADYEDALKRYHDLNLLALQVVRPGGVLLTCSCSGLVSVETFTDTVRRAARRANRVAQCFNVTGAAPDHPVRLDCPESGYLKALWLRVQ